MSEEKPGAKGSSKVGRPTKFNQNLTEKILELAKQGKTNAEIANIVGITERLIYYWRNEKPEFLQALKESKDVADGLVEAALFDNALGGNTTAQIFWLKNRRPKEWRDKQDIEHTGADGKPLNTTPITLIIPDNRRNKPKTE